MLSYVSIVPRNRVMQSYNAVKRKYTSVFTGILEYMQLHMEIHKLVKVYKANIPGYTKIYSGIYVNRSRNV